MKYYFSLNHIFQMEKLAMMYESYFLKCNCIFRMFIIFKQIWQLLLSSCFLNFSSGFKIQKLEGYGSLKPYRAIVPKSFKGAIKFQTAIHSSQNQLFFFFYLCKFSVTPLIYKKANDINFIMMYGISLP